LNFDKSPTYVHDTSVGNTYHSGSLSNTHRKSLNTINMSRSGTNSTSNNNNSNNVLSERVSRISEKINEIHSNIERGKLGKIDEYERKVATLEEKFDEAVDTSEKKFEIVDN